MGTTISLRAADGFELDAYRADPRDAPKGAIVVLQEIFGVNHHIKTVADRFAALGYVAIAPALFDRAEKGIDLGYDQVSLGRDARSKIPMDKTMADTQAAIDFAQQFGKVAVIGYCFGGSVAFLAATRLSGLAAAIGYYGGLIAASAEEAPKVPTMLHFGKTDQSIPLSDVDIIIAAHPDLPIYLYDAGHGFSCDERAAFHETSAAVAMERTMQLVHEHIG